MKLRLFTLLMLTFVFSLNVMATNPVTTSVDADAEGITLVKKTVKKGFFAKIASKAKVAVQKVKAFVKAFDLSDPSTVLKYSLIAIIAGILISSFGWILPVFTGIGALAYIGYLGYLIFLAGAALFWYWVYLKFIA